MNDPPPPTKNGSTCEEDKQQEEQKMLGRSAADMGGDSRGTLTSHHYHQAPRPLEMSSSAAQSFANVAPAEWPALFKAKLQVAATEMDVAATPFDLVNYKSGVLRELVQFVSECHRLPFDLEPWHGGIVDVFRANVFQDSGPPVNPIGAVYDPEEDEPVMDTDWPHLQLVYELFIRFLESPKFNANGCRPSIGSNFIAALLRVFDSEDPRVRECAKTTLHRVYGKFLQLRPLVRKMIQNVFMECIEEDELQSCAHSKCASVRHNCAELLEILGSIVNGFAVPLREEHRSFLLRTLLPMHKCRSLGLFHPQLLYCVVQFVEKDANLTGPVVQTLFRLWPKTHSVKQVLFLNELEQILDLCEPVQFAPLAPQLARRLATCISSAHFQVAERALTILATNDYVGQLVQANAREMLPVLFPALNEHSRRHWNRNVQTMALAVLKMLMDTSPQLFEEAMQNALSSPPPPTTTAAAASFGEGVRKKSILTTTTTTTPEFNSNN